MKKLLYLFILIFICSCEEEKQDAIKTNSNDFSEIIISGKINNRSANDSIKIVKIYVSDILADEKFKIEKVTISNSGDFKTSLLINRTQAILLRYKSVDFDLLVQPNDSLHIVFNDSYDNNKDAFKDAIITGTAKDVNTDLFKFLEDREFNSSVYYNRLKEFNPDSYKIYHDSLFGEDARYIDQFLANNDINQHLKDWLFVEKHYVPADYLLGFPMYHDMFNPEASKTVVYNDNFFNDLKKLPELKISHLGNSNINSFGNYLRFHYYKKIKPDGIRMKSKTLDSLGIRELKKDYSNNPLVVQLAVYDILNSSFENNNLDFIYNEAEFIKDLYNGSIFEPIIKTRKETVITYIEIPDLPKNAKLLDYNYDTAEAFVQDLIKNSNGKLVYIDNWATWCSPCRSEFKEATPLLKKKFSEKVEFVYICHKSKEKLWKPMIAQYKLEGKHYFVTDEQSKMLSEYLNITGFPNYNIIDKNGKTPYFGFDYRPSEKRTTEILNKLTK